MVLENSRQEETHFLFHQRKIEAARKEQAERVAEKKRAAENRKALDELKKIEKSINPNTSINEYSRESDRRAAYTPVQQNK